MERPQGSGGAPGLPNLGSGRRPAHAVGPSWGHVAGGVAGGIVLGLLAGLLIGSFVFESGPRRAPMAQAPPAAAAGGMAPGGMDPGAMDRIHQRITELKALVEKEPRHRAALVELGNLYYDSSQHAQAIPYYERAIAIERNDANLLTDTANCYWISGNNAKAVELFEEAQRRAPDHWQSASNLFYLHQKEGDREAAGRALERARRLNLPPGSLADMERAYTDMTTAER